MVDSAITTTSTLLLSSLHEAGNEGAWREFDERYRPVLIGFARRLDLGPEEAEEVAQEALTQFFRDYRAGAYVRSRGRLRSWLMRIGHNRAMDRWRRKRREPRGQSAIVDLPQEQDLERIWEEQARQSILARALEQIRSDSAFAERSLRAFELVAIRGVSPAAVADELGMTADEVYVVKHRITKRLRGIVDDLTRAYETDAGP